MIRSAVGFAVLLCLAIAGFGIHLVLEQQQRLSSFSVRTTAIVLGKQLEEHERRTTRADDNRYSYEPIVKFRFEVQGQQFTGDSVFPDTFRVGGNLGYSAVRAALERFQTGEETTAYFNPENPAEACLIRRPSFFTYLVVLLPIVVASGLVGFLWRSPQPGNDEFKQRKARWIAAVWHIVGLGSGGHYFYLAGADYGGAALVVFGIYTQLGLIPLTFALPPSEASEFARRSKAAFGLSLIGTFIGFWLGIVVGWLAMAIFSAGATVFLRCWAYGILIPAVLFFILGLMSTPGPQEKKRRVKTKRSSTPARTPATGEAMKSGELLEMSHPDNPIPYQIDERPMPSGEDLETLLPVHVGPFGREEIEEPDDVRNVPIYAQYYSGSAEIFVELGVCGDAAGARKSVERSKAETDAEFPDAAQQVSLKTEPTCFKTNTRLGAFMSWTRGGYYFSAHAKGGEEDLDRFMQAFPY